MQLEEFHETPEVDLAEAVVGFGDDQSTPFQQVQVGFFQAHIRQEPVDFGKCQKLMECQGGIGTHGRNGLE